MMSFPGSPSPHSSPARGEEDDILFDYGLSFFGADAAAFAAVLAHGSDCKIGLKRLLLKGLFAP